MSMAKNYAEGFSFLPRSAPSGEFARRLVAQVGVYVAQIGVYWTALRDGFAAAQKYRELTSRGVPHESAVRAVFEQHLGAR